ncbi:MAG: hypothetical protein QG597_2489 [Actinomycetota bacterium]|nr:hypothetical protein [Actinomycetota bacterium]
MSQVVLLGVATRMSVWLQPGSGAPGEAAPSPSPSPMLVPAPGDLARYLEENPQYANRVARAAVNTTPSSVLGWVVLGAVLAVAWFVVKHLAARAPEGRSVRLYRSCDPWVQALRTWFTTAPVTFVYVATWTVTTVIFQGTPDMLDSMINRFNSTNLVGVLNDPVRVLFSSAFIVADYGFFYIGYVVVFALITARLEQRIGSARVLLVGAGSHVLGSLLTVGVEAVAVHLGMLHKSIVVTQDVGVSYVMVGTCGAYLFLVSAKWRWWFRAGLGIGVVLPLVVQQSIWNLGHFLATCSGIGLYLVVRRWGVRERVTWRSLVASHPPRALPTWSAAPSGAAATAVGGQS